MNQPHPTPGFTLADPSTWVAILSVIAAAVANLIPGHDLSPYVPAVSVVAASIVVAVIAFSKHHLTAGLAALETAAKAIEAPKVADTPAG